MGRFCSGKVSKYYLFETLSSCKPPFTFTLLHTLVIILSKRLQLAAKIYTKKTSAGTFNQASLVPFSFQKLIN
jgi:hypothetical protein